MDNLMMLGNSGRAGERRPNAHRGDECGSDGDGVQVFGGEEMAQGAIAEGVCVGAIVAIGHDLGCVAQPEICTGAHERYVEWKS